MPLNQAGLTRGTARLMNDTSGTEKVKIMLPLRGAANAWALLHRALPCAKVC